MPVTYKKIATVSVTGATAANVEFTGIPGTYDDLIVLASLRSNRAAVSDWAYIAFNGSTANFSAIVLSGDGTTPISYNSFPRIFATATAANATASTFGNSLTYIPNYARSNNKSWSADLVAENNATEGYNDIANGLWSNTAVITSITMTPRVGTAWVTNSSATLYGIKRT